ncbi:MAG: PTS sugar transporter subunit IIA [Candidatus Omnitrophica bacterium]|jgi:mannitol/fructose-specific phosphotransferase system IIA component (Ntr-type)|nr:PTS sugar transporter subunit IIA [Candidatus Omnitrophota bacterium]
MDINILDYLDKDSIIIGLKQKSKKKILAAILKHLIDKKKISKDSEKEILKNLFQREEMGSTAIGGYIALPHARISSIKDIVLCFVVSQEGIEFDSLDQEPVNIIALLLSNQKEAGLHLKMLAFLARMLREKYFVQQLKSATTSEDVLALVNKQQQLIR